MKVDVLKKLIKESVREVIREELSQMQSTPIQENRTMGFTSNDVDMFAYRQNLANSMGLTPPNQPSPSKTGNPYLDIIAQTANEMSPQEKAQMRRNMYD